ncbi:MAG: SDR family oxidoreductase [Deltaproteobacteria bacterium]|jgi:NAD(P)-dependent dehydrogenase (short-subunit alcohol dehydrogenase family)|nr:SDR family oxidoreductase [Deltaproteobacteria bacterium]
MEKKNVFIVGGTSGIGLDIVHRLAADSYEVYVGSRNNRNLEGMAHTHHLSLDVTAESMELEHLPESLQGLVYCPGSITLKPFQRLTADDFIADYNLNLLGAVKVIQASLKKLRKSPDGASIILFSTVAVKIGMPFHASTASAKAAVEGFARSMAAEFAPRIRINVIAPSLTDTPLAENLLSSEQKRQGSADRHPLKRIGTSGEVAQMAVHLLSDEGSWITGQVFHVDGGMSSIRVFK